MKFPKKPLAVLALVAGSIALAGCGGNITTDDGDKSIMSDEVYTLNDGRKVTCIYGPARLSCDWEGASK